MRFLDWVILGALVLLTRVGVAMYQCAVSRSQNAGTTIFRCIGEMCIGILAFWAVGCAIFTGDSSNFFAAGISFNDPSLVLFIMAVMLLASGAVTGASIGRSTSAVWIAGTLLMCGFVVPFGWYLARSLWLGQHGFFDAGGATFLHIAGGCAALATAIILGPRRGKYNHDGSTNALVGHNVPLGSAGILLIFIGWTPYIAGCKILGPAQPHYASGALPAFEAMLAGSAGAVAAMIYSQFRYAKFDIYVIYSGLLGGLVSITAGAVGASKSSYGGAFVAGAVAGIIVPWFESWLDMRWKVDDPAGSVAIQGLGGLWAAMYPVIFGAGGMKDHLHRFLGQSMGVLLIGSISLLSSALVMLLLRIVVGVQVREADEMDGLDLALNDLNAYPDFQQTMIKSYHLRQM